MKRVKPEEALKEAVAILRRHLPHEEYQVALFGSWARGDAAPTSDIDIGLLGRESVANMLLLRIRKEIESIPTLRRIEILDLNQTDAAFREEVLSYARTL